MKRLLFALMSGAFAAQADTAVLGLRGGSAYVRGQPRWAATAGLEGQWRRGWLVLGGAVDASSRVGNLTTGTVRHLFFSGEGGVSVDLADRLRIDLVGEFGGHRLSGSRSGPFHVSDSDPTDLYLGSDPVWAPFVGARPTFQLLFSQLAVGLSAWARADLTPLDPPVFLDPAPFPFAAQHSSIGRVTAGADVLLAVRFQ